MNCIALQGILASAIESRQTELEDVLLNALKAKNTEHQAVLALYEQLKNNQSKRRISTTEGIILELLELCHADKQEGCERDPFGGDNHELTRWLGEQANQLGGMERCKASATACTQKTEEI